eukprot:TRINITY_DN7499_c0_g1_i1.p2 TRINITY_DN7499_c0_g1~~TRINITY_DN7499_c0_g1_i1.p2  ORF type:complete len:221 (-),score=68.78 TRINITY_DN7499_c0_g1_i1:1038-1670(-)
MAATCTDSAAKTADCEHERPQPCHVLLCVTGSVAAIRAGKLAQLLLDNGAEVKIAASKYGLEFMQKDKTWATLQRTVEIYTDEREWSTWHKVGDPVLHIELRKWADVLVIAPLSANTLAKVANGICDNLVTCVARAWDLKRPFVVAPAMNTLMWSHPFTAEQMGVLTGRLGVYMVPPVAKKLACGDIGEGALADVADIVAKVLAVSKVVS